ncbi:uncharacterized protein STEHIDRAFT_165947 [Stereum hirsutum FP-91666 SS1]|uniref:uncharacterized protein n=1 Tax=Stereum hirsutum (strain FP-91666) TaxID=721885 RepID=UPI000440FC83|nr:uncharacterized protein STEHIDRAFT_165947 [Stereum hirsutum FP-91666 SS1]EIM89547.1 hypothetical protein STEHIDRAFT_165947 [Stereum hirsutum FP-91666 SS1]
MLESIASGTSPIARFTENLLFGSIYDRTMVNDWGSAEDDDDDDYDVRVGLYDDLDIEEEEGDEVDEEDEEDEEEASSEVEDASGELAILSLQPENAEGGAAYLEIDDLFQSGSEAEDDGIGMDMEELENAALKVEGILQRALLRFESLKSFKWNVEPPSFTTQLFAVIMDSLATHTTLDTIAFGFCPAYMVLPTMPVFSIVRDVSINIYSDGKFGFSLNHFGVDPARHLYQVAEFIPKFPNVEKLSIHTFDGRALDPDTEDPTLKTLLAHCSRELPLGLKSLSLHNIPFTIDTATAPHLQSLDTLRIKFSTHQDPAMISAEGSFPAIDFKGTTALRTLIVDSPFDSHAFGIIPRAGLRHLSIQGMQELAPSENILWSRPASDAIIAGNASTLESLTIIPELYSGSPWECDDEMMALISECVHLRHLAVTIGAEDQIVSRLLQSTASFTRQLHTLALHYHPPGISGTPRAEASAVHRLVQQLETFIVSTDSDDVQSLRYPAHVCIEHRYCSYRLEELGKGEYRYVKMCTEDIEELESTLPMGRDGGLWPLGS